MNTDIKFDFTGKRFVVTGASSGIGRQLVLDLASAGATVLGIARRENELSTLAAMDPMHIVVASCDVSDKEGLEAVIKDFVGKHGKIDGSVHAAGNAEITSLKMFISEVAEPMVNTSFWGGVNLINIVSKSKIANKGASHIMISSVSAHKGLTGMYIYAAAKAGLIAMCKSLAAELASKSQRINSISLGWVTETEMTNNFKETDDVHGLKAKHLLGYGTKQNATGVIMFMLSSASSWITGTDIIVDGGYLA